MKNLLASFLLIGLALPATEALAQRGQGPFKQAPVQITLNPELKSLPEPELVAKWICSGSLTIALPSLGVCPRRAGYTTVGIATCTQLHEIPRKWKLVQNDGWVKIECVLDFANAEPVGTRVCDYSQCFYISEPEFPWPGTILDELER